MSEQGQPLNKSETSEKTKETQLISINEILNTLRLQIEEGFKKLEESGKKLKVWKINSNDLNITFWIGQVELVSLFCLPKIFKNFIYISNGVLLWRFFVSLSLVFFSWLLV